MSKNRTSQGRRAKRGHIAGRRVPESGPNAGVHGASLSPDQEVLDRVRQSQRSVSELRADDMLRQTALLKLSRAERVARWIVAIASLGDVLAPPPSGGQPAQRKAPGWKLIAAAATFAALMLAPNGVDQLSEYKIFDVATIPAVWDMPVDPPPAPKPGPSMAELRAMLDEAQGPINPNLYDESGALDHFFAGLQNGETVRVVHFGDSPTTADLITADARDLLQKDYGNAGEGFVLIARPWAWYAHRGVAMEARNWGIDVAGYAEVKDGLYGLGGARFRGYPGSTATWKVYGERPRSVEISYLAQTGGGTLVLEADGEPVGTIATALEAPAVADADSGAASLIPVSTETVLTADAATGSAPSEPVLPQQQPAFATFQLPGGAHEVTLRVAEGYVKVFGVEFRNNRPGVIYSSLGINGASVTVLSRVFSEGHLKAQLQHYSPDLVVLAYGTNESGFPTWVEGTWGDELRAAIRRVKKALPETSILLMSPMDRGEVKADGNIGTVEAMPRLVEIERQIAQEEGVAFFNTFEAMGGEGTMGRWYSDTPRLVGADFIHPLPAGAKIVGELLYGALQDGYTGFELRKRREALAAGLAIPEPVEHAEEETAVPASEIRAGVQAPVPPAVQPAVQPQVRTQAEP